MLALLRRDFTELVDAQGVPHWVPLDYTPLPGEKTFFVSESDDFAPRAELVHRALAEAPGLDQELRASGGAWTWSSSELEARVTALDSDIEATEDRIGADRKKLLKRIVCVTTPPDPYTLATEAGKKCDVTPPFTTAEQHRIAFFKDWNNYRLDWNALKSKGISGFNVDRVQWFETRLKQLRDYYASLSGSEPLSPMSPEFKPDSPFAWIYDLVKGAVVIGALGVGGYLLFQAAKSTPKPREVRTPILPGESKPLELPGSMEPAIP